MWTNLITNATLINACLAQQLKEAGLNSSQVSLEAGSQTLHDKIVQQPGAFKKTLEGLRHLRTAGIRVHTNTTICRLNKDEVIKMPHFLKDLGLDKFSMNMLMPQGSALSSLSEVLVRYSEIGNIVLAIQEEARVQGLEFMWYSPTPICIFNPVTQGLGNKGCAACDGLLSIAPNGDILPCSSFPKPMANLRAIKNNFRKVWQSHKFAFFQKKRFAHKKCQRCEDLAVCNGGCPLYWQELGYREILEPEEVLS
jgi:radical SAM protein with 4Fe4S-binding SPASM domain